MDEHSKSKEPADRNRRIRAHRQLTGMVTVQLLLGPLLARCIDEKRGLRPRTEVILECLRKDMGLPPEAVVPPLKRGRPRATTPSEAVLTLPAPVIVEPVDLELADWQSLLKQVPDPRRIAGEIPDKRKCWRKEGTNGLTRLRWKYFPEDPRIDFVKKSGGRFQHEIDYFESRGAWVLLPQQADACIKQFKLVDLQPFEDLQPRYEGWRIEVVDCGLHEGVLLEGRLNFTAALSAVGSNSSLALGLAKWLECCRDRKFRWYHVKADAGDLAKDTLVSEPFGRTDLATVFSGSMVELGMQIYHQTAPLPWREAWAAVVLRGRETPEGLVQPEPHTGCPGHRLLSFSKGKIVRRILHLWLPRVVAGSASIWQPVLLS